ncbi:lysin A [Mycobacterium phage Madruga]|uniref:Lysin A n=1 Tax=Mycobacterium phage Madruga TaxID=1675552 RepID=A0A0K1LS76_9CAUD|nr:lysin A [Mycobacterium phage Madruga]
MPFAPNAYTPDTIMIGIIRACKQLGVDDLATVCAIACSAVESNHKMYANEADPDTLNYPYQALSKDKNSAGIYQQRAPWWDDPDTDDNGGSSDRMDIFRSTKMFINSLLKQKNPTYRENPGVAIANVQQPAPQYRGRYAERMDESWANFNRLKGAAMAPPTGTTPTPAPEVSAPPKPEFRELNYMTGGGRTTRTRPIINFFLHTEEGNASAEALAIYCNGKNGVSYHYTLRDRILCDVVDTDYASWSVLDANVFSINLCFAGSRASMTREQWLQREDDIKIAAWIAVQDCRKYGQSMSTFVIKPPYSFKGPGISDHKYVTQALKIGTHTDVGPNFPWDVFEKYVLLYNGNTNSGDEMTKEEHDKLFQLWGVFMNDTWSSSPYAPPSEGNRWPTKEMIRHTDGFSHAQIVDHNAIILGIPEDVKLVYQAMSYDDEYKADRARRVWKRIPDQYKEEAGLPTGAVT